MGLGIDNPVWVATVFTKDRDRLLTTEMSRKVMAAILAHREVAPLLSDEHIWVDGTLGKAFATGLEPVATPWLTVEEELSAPARERAAGRRRQFRRTAAGYRPRGCRQSPCHARARPDAPAPSLQP